MTTRKLKDSPHGVIVCWWHNFVRNFQCWWPEHGNKFWMCFYPSLFRLTLLLLPLLHLTSISSWPLSFFSSPLLLPLLIHAIKFKLRRTEDRKDCVSVVVLGFARERLVWPCYRGSARLVFSPPRPAFWRAFVQFFSVFSHEVLSSTQVSSVRFAGLSRGEGDFILMISLLDTFYLDSFVVIACICLGNLSPNHACLVSSLCCFTAIHRWSVRNRSMIRWDQMKPLLHSSRLSITVSARSCIQSSCAFMAGYEFDNLLWCRYKRTRQFVNENIALSCCFCMKTKETPTADSGSDRRR